MIELLLIATRVGVRARANNWSRPFVFEPGAFTAHLGRRPIALQIAHRSELVRGVCTTFYEDGDAVMLTARTGDSSIVVPISRGMRFAGGCSVGTHVLDSEIVQDSDGQPLERIYEAEITEVSLTLTPGVRGSRPIAWRWAA